LHPQFLLDRRGLFIPYGLVKAAFQFSERKERFFGDFVGKRKGEFDHVSLLRYADRLSALTQLAAKVVLRGQQHFPAQRAPELVRNDPGCADSRSDAILHEVCAGGEPDWESLYEGLEPRRISLPTYRFARERCWFRDTAIDANANAVLNDKKELGQGFEIASECVPNNRILTEIRQLLGAVLKLSPGRIGLRQRLVECGLDSITTVAFLKELERKYYIQVSAGILIAHPTLESFVGFLLEHHLGALQSTAEHAHDASVDQADAAPISKLAPFQVPFNPLLPDEKLAKFRLFQLARGSLLSVNVSHAIADGYSFYYFLSSWAAACRGESFQPPSHSQSLLNRLVRHSRVDRTKGNSSDLGELEFSFPFLEVGTDPTTRRVETLRFDGAALLTEARDAADEITRNKITENSVLTALVWQTYARALAAEGGELVLACPIDFRRISSELSPSFFGNASAPALLRLEREQVLAESVTRLAALISDAIRRCDELTLARYNVAIDDLRRARGLDATDRVALVDPRNGLIVTNVARFPLPPIDFGTGPFQQEFTPINYAGTAVMVSGEGSTVKVRLSLPERGTH